MDQLLKDLAETFIARSKEQCEGLTHELLRIRADACARNAAEAVE
jgi:hypothetical protein